MILYLIENADDDEVRGIIKQIDRYDTGEIDYQGAETLLENFFCVFFSNHNSIWNSILFFAFRICQNFDQQARLTMQNLPRILMFTSLLK